MDCPACNGKRHARYSDKIGHADVYTCRKCGAVHGRCCLGDSYAIVLPYWQIGPEVDNPNDWFYFDLEVVGSRGVERRHGWAHKETRKIVQVG